ncbi:MAG: PQQ-binding-like beta-propeller repeat protein, partial [Planctomycetota bacterium]
EGALFVQTDQAMLHAIDAETGQTLWAVQVGMADHPSLTPGVNSNLVAVVNGSYVYVLNRYNGKLLWKTLLDGAPGAGASLSERRAYIPTITGLIYSFELEPAKDPMAELGVVRKKRPTVEETAQEKADRIDALRLRQEYVPPLACQSVGRSLVQPIVTRQQAYQEYVSWPTDAGYLFVGLMDRRENRFMIKYRLSTGAGIAAQPSYLPPDPKKSGDSGIIYVTSRDGFVHAILEKTGESSWRFSTGEPILQPAAVVDDNLYVATQLGGMYCLNATSGAQKWWTPSVLQFVAASKTRVYVTDTIDQILVLDINSGNRLDTISGWRAPVKLLNTETDRFYLVADTGLVQCLHEIEQTAPVQHGAERKEAQKKQEIEQEGLTPAAKPKDQETEKPVDEADPFAAKTKKPEAKPKAAPKARPKTAPKTKPKRKTAKEPDEEEAAPEEGVPAKPEDDPFK